LNRRHARRLTGDQVRRPEPHRKRCVRALHDRASSEARIAATLATTQHTGASGDTVRLAGCATPRTDEAIAPSHSLKVGRTGCLVRKQPLKLRQRARKRQLASLENIDRHGNPRLMRLLNILPVVGVCDNPISTVVSCMRESFDAS
jgi:hypothetical protein